MTRQIVKLAILAAFVAGAAVGLNYLEKQRSGEAEKQALRQKAEALEAEKKELEGYIKRLTAEQRVAEIIVVDQVKAGSSIESTTLLFAERTRDGSGTLPPRLFTVRGDGAHIDALVIKFDDDFVARGESLRGKSLVLFYRLFGEHQTPADGFRIDEPGQVPQAYRLQTPQSDAVRQFEQELWQNVWKLTSDDAYRIKMGVRVLSRESPWGTFELDKTYTITLRADGGLTLWPPRPLDPLWREYRDALRRVK